MKYGDGNSVHDLTIEIKKKNPGLTYLEAQQVVRFEHPRVWKSYVIGDSSGDVDLSIHALTLKVQRERNLDYLTAQKIVREEYPEAWKAYVG
jgi:hypothetical protein